MTHDISFQVKDFDYNGVGYRVFLSHKKIKHEGESLNPLYFLDGNAHMEAMVESYLEGGAASVLYIGVGYQDDIDILKARTFDYTVSDGGEKFQASGGAAYFYHFIVNVLKPWVNCSFNINKENQTLAGHSFGGHFALYVAFNYPTSFQRYVVASPSIWWADGAVLPTGEIKIGPSIDWISLIIGGSEEKLDSDSSDFEMEIYRKIKDNPRLNIRNLASALIKNGERCSFEYLPGRKHHEVVQDYVKIANFVASQKK